MAWVEFSSLAGLYGAVFALYSAINPNAAIPLHLR
jgi:hypothetical protein